MKTTEEIINTYVQRIEALEDQLVKVQTQNEVLKKQLDAAKKSGASGSSSILADGEEADLYPNERHEILLDVLQEAVKNMKAGSRRYDVLQDLIAHNPVSGEPKRRANKIKNTLKGYRGMNEKIKGQLAELGITANDQHRKHYMLHYFDEPRYFITMTASGSDAGRGGKNLASDIIKKFF